MPAATPKMDAVKLWTLDSALVLCITDSGTMGEIWNSRSVAMMGALLCSLAYVAHSIRNAGNVRRGTGIADGCRSWSQAVGSISGHDVSAQDSMRPAKARWNREVRSVDDVLWLVGACRELGKLRSVVDVSFCVLGGNASLLPRLPAPV